jgi:hypothetical protein
MTRSDALTLIEAITHLKNWRTHATPWETKFIDDMNIKLSHYGYPVSPKQSKTLQEVYRKVHMHVQENDTWLS